MSENELNSTPCSALPELWVEITEGKEWARAYCIENGELRGLSCELRKVGNKYRWMTMRPQKFGSADTLQEAIQQVEAFKQNKEITNS